MFSNLGHWPSLLRGSLSLALRLYNINSLLSGTPCKHWTALLHDKLRTRKDAQPSRRPGLTWGMAAGGQGHPRPTNESFLQKQSHAFRWLTEWLLWASLASLNHVWSVQYKRCIVFILSGSIVRDHPTKADATQKSESLWKPRRPTSHLAWKHSTASDSERSMFVLEGLIEKDKSWV